MTSDGKEHALAENVEWLAREFNVTEAERAETIDSGQNRPYKRVGWATSDLSQDIRERL